MLRASAKRTQLAAAALVAVAALATAGCTDDSPPARVTNGHAEITLDDFLIRPQGIRATPGPIEVRVVNRGAIGHTLRVFRGSREVLAVPTLLPGASARASATLARGNYKLVCILGNHEDLGMYGTLTVR